MGPISLASCVVDPELGVVSIPGAQLRLTTKEAALFVYLAERPHQTVSRAELLREVWGFRGARRTAARRTSPCCVCARRWSGALKSLAMCSRCMASATALSPCAPMSRRRSWTARSPSWSPAGSLQT
ncbi:MAG: winged helix-turn-helix transcriptional regulator [Deltaproteobacteria bacterium]|nr:winged helix-turn-helix transcriptional regulator [Deltaproteobacteria bacterium]